MMSKLYTTQLQAGLGVIQETGILLNLWTQGMSAKQLYKEALESGFFPCMSARRLHNLITECFAPRLLKNDGKPAAYLKCLISALNQREIEQILFIYACRANTILEDFICNFFWPHYSSGRDVITNQEAREFVVRANQQGLTTKFWSESTIRRVSAYLTGACADFGFLERGSKSTRKILSTKIEQNVATVLAYDLHFSGLGDNTLAYHPNWALFGMGHHDVVAELKRLSLRGILVVQTAGEMIRIGWQCKNSEELSRAISQG